MPASVEYLRCSILYLLSSMLTLVLLASDPSGAGVRSLGGLVGSGRADVRDDGRAASV